MTKTAESFFKNERANRMLWGGILFIDERDAVKIAGKYAREIRGEKDELIKWIMENRFKRGIDNSLFFNTLTAKFYNIKTK